MQDFVVIKLYLKLNKEKNLKEVAGEFYSFITMPDITEGYTELIEKCQRQKPLCNQVLLITVHVFIISRF